MSKADEMFKTLGYIIHDYNSEKYIKYGYKKSLMGDWIEHEIIFSFISKLVLFEGTKGFDMNTLQAINEKCKELGWVGE